MKNLISRKAARILGLITLTAMASIGLARPITVAVDGRNIEFSGTQPVKMGNTVMVPLRGVFERMGASVDWQESNQTVLAHRGNTRVELRVNDTTAYVNGKAMAVNRPAVVRNGSTLVPIRFISESLGAYVDWDETSSMVNISSDPNNRTYGNSGNTGKGGNDIDRTSVISVQPKGSVVPVKLDSALDSKTSEVGDKFTATVDTNGNQDYFGLPQGTKIEGHVSFAQPKSGDTPGAIGLIFDRILLVDGRKVPIEATLIGLDKESVDNRNGRIVAKVTDKKKEDMKYVGTGAGAGALLAIVTKGNIITNSLIGGALGYLYQTLIGNKNDAKNVVLDRGTPLGVRMDQDVSIRIPVTTSAPKN